MEDDEGILATEVANISEDEDRVENVHDHNDAPSDEDEDEDECRVCRGPAEEGRPLFSPCKCSGSIGLTHQDCLTSWLAVTRGEGRCELCKVKFHFAPQYAENAPDRLAFPEVLMGIGRRAVARWLPFLLRLSFCLSLWLVVAPLVTSYLYLILMNRSFSCVFERWEWELVPGDAVSGAVLAAIILISFLSLMSFADFLRVEWQQQHQQLDPLENDAGRRLRQELFQAAEDNRRREHEVNNALLLRVNQERNQREGPAEFVRNTNDANPGESAINTHIENNPDETELNNQDEVHAGGVEENIGHQDNRNIVDRNVENQNVHNAAGNDHGAANNPMRNNLQPQPPQGQAEPIQQQRQAQRNNPRANVDPMLQEDQVDMEINVALDELLGLRGPISSLLRNLLWLLVFNAVYLGFFAFIPKTIGSVVFSNMLNTTLLHTAMDNLPSMRINETDEQLLSLKTAVSQVNQESSRLNTVFQLPDFASVNLGYLFCAAMIIMLRLGWMVIVKCRATANNHENNDRQAEPHAGQNNNLGMQGGMNQADRAGNAAAGGQADGVDHQAFALGEAISLVLDAAVSIVKVGILLFLKMFLLPVLLGLWLDISSMTLFGSNIEDRILYAGKDLFSFILLHWVAGITFMLLVTVSVLQLREVAHANLLAHLIRPQEPQPDLLGNLMHDSVVTQTKRMLLSLAIYTVLLHLHVSIPVKFLMKAGVTDFLPFLKLRFWHLLMPQLQVPIELLVFHLSMLALLEKYKNSIGEMQHHWLLFMCNRLGLAHFILPHEVEKFELVGKISVFDKDLNVNPLLYSLADETQDETAEDMIFDTLKKQDLQRKRGNIETVGETRDSGERVLKSGEAYISLPKKEQSQGNNAATLLSTKLGCYRLKIQENPKNPTKESVIEVWKEVAGKAISRPPEGWDDLGAGGADIQGRWAWGKEKQSVIEKGLARRATFFGPRGHSGLALALLLGKVGLLLLSSWMATTLLLVFLVSAPLGLGRLLYLILRVPEAYVHYPLVFALGSAIAFPLMAFASSLLVSPDRVSLMRSLSRWIASFQVPPPKKALVVLATLSSWCLVCPLVLGLIYELCLNKSPAWFSREELFNPMDLVWIWVTGSTLLNCWACLCSLNVFTRGFWVNVGNGMLEVEGDNRRDGQENAPGLGDEAGDDELSPRWQGREGRMARFFAALKRIFSKWEWEAVDHVVLLMECSIPVSKNLCTLFVVPSLCYFVWFYSMDALLNLGEIDGRHRLYLFRLASASTLLIQLCVSFRKHIRQWFSAIHKTARDDRYLIGETLLNYQPEIDS